jgi:hypothetical protein
LFFSRRYIYSSILAYVFNNEHIIIKNLAKKLKHI